jgi:hypothetical protein
MLRKGDTVRILPEHQDAGDGEFVWRVVGDEEKGRVDVSPVSIQMTLKPVYTLHVNQVELVEKAT